MGGFHVFEMDPVFLDFFFQAVTYMSVVFGVELGRFHAVEERHAEDVGAGGHDGAVLPPADGTVIPDPEQPCDLFFGEGQ